VRLGAKLGLGLDATRPEVPLEPFLAGSSSTRGSGPRGAGLRAGASVGVVSPAPSPPPPPAPASPAPWQQLALGYPPPTVGDDDQYGDGLKTASVYVRGARALGLNDSFAASVEGKDGAPAPPAPAEGSGGARGARYGVRGGHLRHTHPLPSLPQPPPPPAPYSVPEGGLGRPMAMAMVDVPLESLEYYNTTSSLAPGGQQKGGGGGGGGGGGDRRRRGAGSAASGSSSSSVGAPRTRYSWEDIAVDRDS
jgi:hypothetical protein